MKKLILIGFTVMIFFLKNKALANYEKVFFDFKIDSISGEKIDFQDYKNKLFESAIKEDLKQVEIICTYYKSEKEKIILQY